MANSLASRAGRATGAGRAGGASRATGATVARTNAARVLSFGVKHGLEEKPRARFERELTPDRISNALMFDLWATLVRETGELDLPIAIAEELELEQLDLLGLVVMTAPTVKDSLESFARFAPLLNDGRQWCASFPSTKTTRLVLSEGSDALSPSPSPSPFSSPSPSSSSFSLSLADGRRFSQETAVAQVVRSIRILCNDDSFRPTSIGFVHSAPTASKDALRTHRAFFDCELRFDQAATSIELPRNILEIRPRLANVALWRHLSADAERAIAALMTSSSTSSTSPPPPSLRARVLRAIDEAIVNGEAVPEIADIAAKLGTTERTLRRQLARSAQLATAESAAADDAASFREMVDDARRRRAEHLLKLREAAGSTMTEIAFELGFADSSSFTHACRRWFGSPPTRCA